MNVPHSRNFLPNRATTETCPSCRFPAKQILKRKSFTSLLQFEEKIMLVIPPVRAVGCRRSSLPLLISVKKTLILRIINSFPYSAKPHIRVSLSTDNNISTSPHSRRPEVPQCASSRYVQRIPTNAMRKDLVRTANAPRYRTATEMMYNAVFQPTCAPSNDRNPSRKEKHSPAHVPGM